MSATATTPALMTAEELFALGDGGGRHRYELVRGELHVYEPPGFDHDRIAVRIAARLLAHAEPRGLGAVVVETGYVLCRGPDTMRGSDVSFVSAARVPEGAAARRYVEGHADLAVEVLSPDDRAGEVLEKVAEYLQAGTALVWVVSPARRTVAVYAPDADPRVLGEDGVLDGGELLPGLALAVADLFR